MHHIKFTLRSARPSSPPILSHYHYQASHIYVWAPISSTAKQPFRATTTRAYINTASTSVKRCWNILYVACWAWSPKLSPINIPTRSYVCVFSKAEERLHLAKENVINFRFQVPTWQYLDVRHCQGLTPTLVTLFFFGRWRGGCGSVK